jgi:hypothetical protein
MSSRTSAAPSDAPRRPDDFEWPPSADDLSVYELGPDPFHARQATSNKTVAVRRREPSPRLVVSEPPSSQRLPGAITAAVIVAAVAGWVLYFAVTRPAPIVTVHHPAVAAPAPSSVPQRITIVATYPAEPVTAPGAPEANVANAGVAAPPPAAPIAEAIPETIPETIAAPAAEPAAAESTPAETPDAGIRSLLQRYEDAYDRRDVKAAAALWPSLDQDALTLAFASLDRQDVHFDHCDIDATEARGTAVCVGTVRSVPSVGQPVEKEERITWTFALARPGEDWRIDGLSAR